MNLLTRAHNAYQNFVLNKVPHPLRHLKFLVMLLIVLAVPLTIVLSQSVQDLRQRASDLAISAVQDPLTGEYFDLEIKNTITRYTPGPEGGALGVNAIFSASGNRVSSLSTLTGFVGFADGYPEQKTVFTKDNNGVFQSAPVKLLTYGCAELYSTLDKNPGFYIGTFCFGRPFIVDAQLQSGTHVYSANSSPGMFIEAFNSGDQSNYTGAGADILINSMVFNKNNGYYRQYGAFGKIYYVGTNATNLTEFKNLYYSFEIPHSNDDLKPCGEGQTPPQKTFRNAQNLSGFVNGTNTTNSSVTNGPGGCGATYTSTNNLTSGFVGIYYGGIFDPKPVSIPIPTSPPYTPTPTAPYPPTPYPSSFMSPTPTPTALRPTPCLEYGDPTGDYRVGFDDISIMKQMAAGTSPFKDWQLKNADVDGSGSITASDISLVSAYINGTIPTFPVCSGIFGSPTPTIFPQPSPYPSKTPYPTTPTPTYGMSPTPTYTPKPSSPISTPTPTAFKCDFNKDRYLDILDYNIWLKQFINGGKPMNPSADCDNNGAVDIFDYNIWLREFRGFKR